MTIRHLLTHTSGLTYGWDQKAYVDSLYRATGTGGWDGTISEKVKILAKLPLKHQPGTKYEYSLSIDVAGYLVEILSGTPLDVYMKTKIFDPLKMNDTGFYVPEEKHSRFSGLYTIKNDTLKEAEGRMKEAFKKPVTLFSGGGGLVSTIDDYLTFSRMLLNGGELDGIRIIKESTAKLIMTNQLPAGVIYAENKGYGLAGDVNLETGVYGWAGAASTKFWIDPRNKMIVILGTQLMPADFSYADEFYKIVNRALK
jgi:CubicO group peptidase (beta-lactamase class C family)